MYKAVEVQSEAHKWAFHKLPFEIYKTDKQWIAPLTKDVESVFDREKNLQFQEGDLVRYLLYKDNNVVGRVAAFYKEHPTGRQGGMGFFECINDQNAAFELFEACKTWLLGKGCTFMDGPINFGDRDSFWGLLIEAKRPPSFRENYHPVYYKEFFEAYGFEKIIEQNTCELTEADFNFERFNKLASRVFQNPQYTFKHLDLKNLDVFANDFCEIYNQAWSFHEDFKPMTPDKVKKRLREVKSVLNPYFAVFAYSGNTPIGFYINILEVNQIFRKFKGVLNFWNKMRFLWERKRIDTVRGIIFGVIPKYHNLGIETGLIMKFYESYKKQNRIKKAELAWIGDFNPKMLSMLESLGAKTSKVHRTYRKNF